MNECEPWDLIASIDTLRRRMFNPPGLLVVTICGRCFGEVPDLACSAGSPWASLWNRRIIGYGCVLFVPNSPRPRCGHGSGMLPAACCQLLEGGRIAYGQD